VNLKSIKSIHFTGIKGVGLTSLALCAQDLGISVSGSDIAEEFVTDPILKLRGISYTVGFSPNHLPPATNLLIYTAAHQGPNNPEVIAAREQGIPAISHAEAVGMFMQEKIGISVCGVGGKSTTSAMLATILEHAKLKPSYTVGVGNIPCLGTPGKYDRHGKYFIAEADEYFASPGTDNTPKFLYQTPQVIGVTTIRYDHPDVYPDFDATCQAYLDFFNKLPKNGLLVAYADSSETIKVAKKSAKHLITYGTHPQADIQLKSYHVAEGKTLCTISYHGIEHELVLQVPGKFNAINALCAFAIATKLDVDPRIATNALKEFTGTMRRFENIGTTKSGVTIIDDYAHHPGEIQATLTAAKEWFPKRKVIAIFQPHTFSRTKALFADFAQSFGTADEAVILPIYASAREAFDPSIKSQDLVAAANQSSRVSYQENAASLIQYLKSTLEPNPVVITLGAGDIFLLGKKLLKGL